jgi:ornithine carbamoyltransferase
MLSLITNPREQVTSSMHFLQISHHEAAFLRSVLREAVTLRNQLRTAGRNDPVLLGRTLAMIFEKPSLRTRVSFEAGMNQLGGSAINLQPAEIGLGIREPAKDAARVIGGMCDGIMARVFAHQTAEDLARHSPVPVINGLSDLAHPCQALADLLTIQDEFGEVAGRRVVYVGDANNVMRSLAAICGKFEMPFIASCPSGYGPADEDVARLRRQIPQMEFDLNPDPRAAVARADVIYTDTWTSMGQEAEKARRIADFAGYTVDDRLLASAPKHAIVLHCLPAYRGLEISDEVLEGPRSRVFPQAHNRLHAQKGLLSVLLRK